MMGCQSVCVTTGCVLYQGVHFRLDDAQPHDQMQITGRLEICLFNAVV